MCGEFEHSHILLMGLKFSLYKMQKQKIKYTNALYKNS